MQTILNFTIHKSIDQNRLSKQQIKCKVDTVPETSILNNSCPFSTVSPSATRSSRITPAAGQLTGNAVCKQRNSYNVENT